MTIWCGDRVFDAHRLVLCACSPLFKSMLTRQPSRVRRPPEHQPIVFLKDVSPVHFERLLQFMYCGEVRVPNNELEELLATATSLSVRGLATAQDKHNSHLQQVQQQQVHEQTLSKAQPFLHDVATVTTHTQVPPSVPNKTPAPPPPKKRRLSRDAEHHFHHHHSSKKSPLSPLDSNRQLKNIAASSACRRKEDTHRIAQCHSEVKDEDEAVSPPPQPELVVPILSEHAIKATSLLSAVTAVASAAAAQLSESGPTTPPTPRILPPSEPRKTGTCYFCKKSFMKNKQLMNHVCPKKPRGGSGGGSSKAASSSPSSIS